MSGECRRERGIQGSRSGRLGNGEGDGDEDRATATVEEEKTERRLGVELAGRARRWAFRTPLAANPGAEVASGQSCS